MKIAVLSGKGGAGKTFVATNLAALSKESLYVDCDVEAPNGHLFLKPEWYFEDEVTVDVPNWNPDKCLHCNTCVAFCRYGSIVKIKEKIHVFEDVCHACGGCMTLCPGNALGIKAKKIGKVAKGRSDIGEIISGWQDLGIASGVPIISTLIEMIEQPEYANTTKWIDCPPGTACTVIESIISADFCILVAEPTKYGLHNLKMVVELVGLLKKSFGVVVNRYRQSNHIIEAYCEACDIKVLGLIPFETEIGEIVSSGKLLVKEAPEYRHYFRAIAESVERILDEEVDGATAINT